MTDDLRLHAGREPGPNPAGELVLYWMQGVTLRATENPALNFAIEEANRRGLPVVVYQGLRDDYPWASARIHTFILESVADLQREFGKRGIQYGFYLETPASRAIRGKSSPLVALADRAALVVTDYFPTFIQPRQLRSLREKTETPVIAIDSATVVPLRRLEVEYQTARAIRPVLEGLVPHYLHPVPNPEPVNRQPVELPFEPVSVPDHPDGIAELVRRCAVDQSVRPSPTIRGGTRRARARLSWFLEHGLRGYAERRNDPNVDATSRLSPYLHFGNISIQEVLLAVEAAGPAADWIKFRDEALVWRELAHNLCFKNASHRTLDAIPGWARRELDEHTADPRPALYDDETLERGETESELWNACQRSLIRDGELHNYLRMLWGKSVLKWTPSAAEALRVIEHLNHKYALDGRDPNSYGGILWCFGRFDRPFYRHPIFGTVRYMSLDTQRKKFDVEEYCRRYPPAK